MAEPASFCLYKRAERSWIFAKKPLTSVNDGVVFASPAFLPYSCAFRFIAEQLAVELIEPGDSIRAFPYANPVHMLIRLLGHEYRKLLVHNYLMFYRVDKEKSWSRSLV